jgi:cytoskeleton protein RodZ
MCSDELHVNAPSNWFAPPLSEMNNMNDTSSTTSATTAGTAHHPVTGAGQLLRQYREGAGLHIVALSSALKVARAKLEALEADRLDDLPDVVFARALAMSCCRYLGKDAEPVLALMPGHAAQPGPHLRQHLPTPQDYNAPRPKFTPSRGPFGNRVLPPWSIWTLVLLVIVVGGWFAASPQRAVVKAPVAPLDFPPQGVPGAEPVGVVEPPASASGASTSVAPVPLTAPGAMTATSPSSAGGSMPATITPVVPAPVGTPALRVEPVAPARP